MTVVVSQESQEIALQNYLNKAAPQNQVLKLFRNDYVPNNLSTEANFTEANFTGYAAIALSGASWVTAQGVPTVASYAQQAFTASGAGVQTIFGYYVVQASSGKLMWAERFDTPQVVQFSGDFIRVTPTFFGQQ